MMIMAAIGSPPALAAQSLPAVRQLNLAGQIELARLVDLGASRLGLQVEYDAAALKGTVTLRQVEGLSDDELWALINRVLASRGWATVQLAGASSNMLSVVKLADAPGLASIRQADSDEGSPAGFTSVVTRVSRGSSKQVIEAIKLVLSKPGGSVTDLTGNGLLLISDLRARIDEALRLVDALDANSEPPIIERLETRFVPASQLAPVLAATSAARDSMDPEPRRGKLVPTTDGDALILVCPAREADYWRELISRLDQRESLTIESYTPKAFRLTDVAKLIEDSVHTSLPGITTGGEAGGNTIEQLKGSGDRWRMVIDELTGSLIITATPSEHSRIATLLKRLESVPQEARRPLKSFTIRNRNVKDLTEVLSRLLDAGVLEGPDSITSDGSPPQHLSATSSASFSAPSAASAQGSTVKGASSSGSDSNSDRKIAPDSKSQSNQKQTPRAMRKAEGETSELTLTADESTNTLIAVGDARLLGQLEDLIRKLDVRQPQVMIEVLVVTLSDADTLDLGVELEKIEIAGSTTISLASLFGLSSIGAGSGSGTGGGGTGGNGSTPAPSRGRGFTGVAISPGDFSVVIRALQTLNHGRSLTFPRVLVNNNQQATLDSVLEQPFVSTNASSTVATTSFGGSENAGTVITIKPQIAEADHLVLEYSVSLSAFVGEATDPSVPPPKQSNNLSSIVTIPDGYTVVVGGLEISSQAQAVSQIPLLGSIPGIGEAFKNRSKSQSRSRFYVFIHSEVLRRENFEDLKFISDQDTHAAGIDDGWPEVQPRIIR